MICQSLGWCRIGLLLLALVGGCTSFTFPGRGETAPPDALVDRSAMVSVPAGRFLMGANRGQPDEFPVHEVQVSAFLLDRTEVSNGQYNSCVEAGRCRPAAYADDPVLGRTRHPVVGVTWRDGRKYCRWVRKRLPTEAEWEYAARIPSFAVFPWEGRFKTTFANARGDVDGYDKTAPVGAFETGRSGLGLLDMAGNAAEWTQDWYDATYYQRSPAEDPTGPAISTGGRVVRGGSWADNDYLVRSTARDSLEPNLSRDTVGFRCAADPGGGAG